jgi:hypothetical protein
VTHLGRITRVATALIRPDGTVEGEVVFTAANGDQLAAELHGAFSPTTILGTYTFTGGTGRFEGAAGEADFHAVTSDGIHVAIDIAGTVKY